MPVAQEAGRTQSAVRAAIKASGKRIQAMAKTQT